MVTITSKRQITLPTQLFLKSGLKRGHKLMNVEKDGGLVIEPAIKAVYEAMGIAKRPVRYKGMEIDEVIEKAKQEYFGKKTVKV